MRGTFFVKQRILTLSLWRILDCRVSGLWLSCVLRGEVGEGLVCGSGGSGERVDRLGVKGCLSFGG